MALRYSVQLAAITNEISRVVISARALATRSVSPDTSYSAAPRWKECSLYAIHEGAYDQVFMLGMVV